MRITPDSKLRPLPCGTRLALAAVALAFAGGAWAQMGPGGMMSQGGGPGMQRSERPQLLTQEERDQFRNRMHAAKTPEERQTVRQEMRTLTEQRAKERGVTLPEPRAGRGEGRGPHAGHDGAHGPRHGMHHGNREGARHERHGKRDGSDARPRLFSQEERNKFRDRMHAAKTPEERQALRNEMRTLAEQRAKEKGIELKPGRGEGRHRHGPRSESSRG